MLHPYTENNCPDNFKFWDECFQMKLGVEGKPMFFEQIDRIKKRREKDPAVAYAKLSAIIDNELAWKATHLDPLECADRAGARDRAMFETSQASGLMRRYQGSSEREFHRGVAAVQRFRREAARGGESGGYDPDGPPLIDAIVEELRNEPVSEVPAPEPVAPAAPAAPSARIGRESREARVLRLRAERGLSGLSWESYFGADRTPEGPKPGPRRS